MTTYARIVDNAAIDVVMVDPAILFHPDLAATFTIVPAGTQTGDRKNGDTWVAYVAPTVTSVTPVPPAVTPPQFKLLILPELARVLALVETDANVRAFVSIIDDPRLTEVDLSLNSVQSGIQYAFDKIGMSAGDIATRMAQILTGVPT